MERRRGSLGRRIVLTFPHLVTPSPTPEPVLSRMYPTRDAYLERFDEALEAGIRDGFLLREDADAMKAEAAGYALN